MMPGASTWDRLADALEYPVDAPASIQQQYVDAFDLDPACSLEIGWHLFGESPERGAFLSILREDLARAGIFERGDLPDHLPTLLRLIAREDDESAAALAAIIAPAVAHLAEYLRARRSPFADAIDAVARALDARTRHEEPL
jgi:nitrate reductase molybdenum cofactor assembly chaperone NarJ/NarW